MGGKLACQIGAVCFSPFAWLLGCLVAWLLGCLGAWLLVAVGYLRRIKGMITAP